jgi:hypothetical protein
MKAIPTIYNGQLFRSRLEAKWACFFDMVGWQWEYEPMDLDGWIPDFLINGATKVLCDVKPTQIFMPEIAQKMERAVAGSGFAGELMLIAMAPFTDENLVGWSIGWLWQEIGPDEEVLGGLDGGPWGDWGPAILGMWKAGSGQLGFCHGTQSYRDRITGGYDGGCYGEFRGGVCDPTLTWRQACNQVMWNRPETVNQ